MQRHLVLIAESINPQAVAGGGRGMRWICAIYSVHFPAHMHTHYCTRSWRTLYGHLTLCLNIEWAFTNEFPEPQQHDISKCGCRRWGFRYCLYYLKFWVLTDLVWLYSSIQQELSQTCNTFLHNNNHCPCSNCLNNTPTVMTLDTRTMSLVAVHFYKTDCVK